MKEPQAKEAKAQVDSESSEEEKEKPMTEAEKYVKDGIERLFTDYFLSDFQKMACRKFIKDKVGDPDN